MKPILFDKDSTTFTTNGLGRLDCISCQVTEERNGMYELEMLIPEDSNHANEIEMSSIVVVKASQNSGLQAFRVYKITKPFNGRFEVLAQHISYQLSYIPCMPFEVAADSTACNQTLQGLKNNSAEDNPFTFWTDVTTVASYKQTIPSSIRQRLGGIEGSLLDQFGGEYEWDNYTVKLWKNRGVQIPNVSLRYGKNITDISQEEYISNTVTGICPYWQDVEGDNVVMLSQKVVESEYADNYPFKRTVPVDFSQEFETAPTEQQLLAAAEDYLDKEGIGIPTVSIKLSFINLADTEEYKEIAPLQNVSLCDRVYVQFEKLGINTTAKIVKTVYDVLAERYTSIEIGSVKSSLAHTISDTNGALETTLDKALYATKNATAWLTGSNGYVMAVKNSDGTWKELLFMDTDDAETAVNVLRINENGIGFSRNGVNGPYTQAWTMDGKLVIGGTNVPSFSVMYNNVEVCHIDKNGITWNYRQTNKKAVTIKDNRIELYSWQVDLRSTVVGNLFASSWAFSGGDRNYKVKYADLSGDSRYDTSDERTGVQISLESIQSGNNLDITNRVFSFDSYDLENNLPPYIINTANGTMFPDNGRGITVKNGLITDWLMPGSNTPGNENIKTIVGAKIRSGIVQSISTVSSVYEGTFSVGNKTINVVGGKIVSVENI